MRKSGFVLAVVAVCWLSSGCLNLPPASVVLSGTWTATGENGDTLTFRFDSVGSLVEISGTSADGLPISAAITGARSNVDGASVSIRIPSDSGDATLSGGINGDRTEINASLDGDISFDDTEIELAAGAWTLLRVTGG